MKKILSLIMVFFLLFTNTIFATEGEGSQETAPLSSETAVGLYYLDAGSDSYLNKLYLTLGVEITGDFYFYNGVGYQKVSTDCLTPSANIKLSLIKYRGSLEQESTLKIGVFFH